MKRLAIAGALLLTGLPALALYKVVGPDGRVTYTDRPPIDAAARVSILGRDTSAPTPTPDAILPIELRQAMAKFPVTLYTAPECAPCDTARTLLQQRGVPYAEKQLLNEDDAAAYERLVGTRTIPAATIGAQPLRGLSATEWHAYLDAAGYPRESRLPQHWQPAAATPLVARTPAPQPEAERSPPAPAALRPAEPAPSGSLRF